MWHIPASPRPAQLIVACAALQWHSGCWLLYDVIIALQTGKDRSRRPPSQASLTPSKAKLSCIKLLAAVDRCCLWEKKASEIVPRVFKPFIAINLNQGFSYQMLSSFFSSWIDSPRPASSQHGFTNPMSLLRINLHELQATPLSSHIFTRFLVGKQTEARKHMQRQALSAPVDDETTCLH